MLFVCMCPQITRGGFMNPNLLVLHQSSSGPRTGIRCHWMARGWRASTRDYGSCPCPWMTGGSTPAPPPTRWAMWSAPSPSVSKVRQGHTRPEVSPYTGISAVSDMAFCCTVQLPEYNLHRT